MKIIIFLIIVVIVYYLATQVKVIHINNLHPDAKSELENKNKIKTLLTNHHVKTPDSAKPIKISKSIPKSKNMQKKVTLPDSEELINIIKHNYVDTQYKFNIPNLPVTTRYSNNHMSNLDNKYLQYIRTDIREWDKNIFANKKHIQILDLKLIFIEETADEFIIKLNAKLLYQSKTLHLELTYYGQTERNNDFINVQEDIYTLQLVSLKPISKLDYNNKDDNTNAQYAPFMTMNEQMEYVNSVNQMHREEGY